MDNRCEMNSMRIINIIKSGPVIAAARYEKLDYAVRTRACAVELVFAGLADLMGNTFLEQRRRKSIFIHTDLLKGLSGDSEAIRFLRRYVKPAGIVSTKSPVIRAAKKEGLLTIQRVFLIDTISLDNALKSVRENNPDAVEIMPGIATSIIPQIKERITQPVIMAGLIRERRQIVDALKWGADGVSLSKDDLWDQEFNGPA